MGRAANTITEFECPQCGAPVAMPGYADVAVCGFCGSTLRRHRKMEAGGVPIAAPAPDAVVPAEEEVLRSVQCSQCAGPLSAREGRRILVCGRCGVRVMVKEHGGVSRWYYPTRFNRLKAAAAAAAWLDEHPGIAKQARHAQFVEAQLVYAPIWEHRALLTGWEFGSRTRTVTEFIPDVNNEETGRMEIRMVNESVNEARLQERRFYQPAADFEALGVVRPRVSGRELMLPLLAGELDSAATVLTEDGTGKEVAERGRRAALQPLGGATSPDSHLFVFRESTALLYYPFWMVHFRPKHGTCRVVVNGRDGSVNSAEAPADNTKPIALLVGQILIMAVIVAIFLWMAIARDTGRASFVAAAVIVLVIAVLSVWRFRKVGEVEYREPFSS